MNNAVDKPFSPACERNREPHSGRAARVPGPQPARAGDWQWHRSACAVHFAAALPNLVWQTSDVAENHAGIKQWLAEAGLPNTPAPLAIDVNQPFPAGRYDAMFTANTLHIMSWTEVQQLFAALPPLMAPGGLLVVYGPFKHHGQFSTESNAQFDAPVAPGPASPRYPRFRGRERAGRHGRLEPAGRPRHAGQQPLHHLAARSLSPLERNSRPQAAGTTTQTA